MAKKKKKVQEADLQTQIAEWTNVPTEIHLIPVRSLVENTWNPNVMPDHLYQKLRANMFSVWTQLKMIPVPVVARWHPTMEETFQIVDGKHRKDVFLSYLEAGDTRFEYIPCILGDFDTKTAMLLTAQLNYLHGEKDPKKYAEYLHTLNTDEGIALEELGDVLPETKEEIQDTLAFYDLEPALIDYSGEEESLTKPPRKEDMVEFKVLVYPDQYEVISAELTRIGSILKGKNIQGRALEFMAVNSSLTPLASIEPGAPDPRAAEPSMSLPEQKKRLKEVARD